MRLVKWFLSKSSYLLYTLGILAGMLWYLFPSDAATVRIENELHRAFPGLEWKIAAVRPAWPVALRLTDVAIRQSGTEKEQLLTLKSFSLQPVLWTYLQNKNLQINYRAELLHGLVQGKAAWKGGSKSIIYDGTVRGIQVERLKALQQQLDRSISGTLSGTFSGKKQLQGRAGNEFQGSFSLAAGVMSFQEPVLGMEQLSFSRLSGTLQTKQNTLTLAKGIMESPLLSGTFSGTVALLDDFFLSEIAMQGALTPRSEFLTAMGSESAGMLLKKHLKNGKFPFTINGTVKKPGIVFPGMSVELNRQLQEGR